MCENGNKDILAPVAWIMVALTAINLAFTYFIVDYRFNKQNIENFGSKENYEKALIVQKAQYNQAFGSTSKEDLETQVKNAFGGAWANHNMEEPKEVETWKLTKEDLVANTPVYGKKEAKYSIYEFSDFECPYCQQFHKSGLAKQAVDKNPETLNYIKRNFQFHKGAPMKAEVALCAIDQKWDEGYFTMVDAIFNGTLRESKEDILAMAETAWLDKAKIEECLTSGKNSEKLTKDYNIWVSKMWVTWTPSVFVVNNETGEFKRLGSKSIEAIEELMKSF